MKITQFILFAGLLSTNIAALPVEYFQLGKKQSLVINGDLQFKDLVLEKNAKVNGSMRGEKLQCHKLEIKGSSQIDGLQANNVKANGSFSGKNITIDGDAIFKGALFIKMGNLNNVQIKNTKATLKDTKVKGNLCVNEIKRTQPLFINRGRLAGTKARTMKDDGLARADCTCALLPKQILKLTGDTIISGDVIFEQEGEVHLFDTAKILGKIIKATVIKATVCTKNRHIPY